MTPELLRTVATAVFGPRFQRALSHALHVNERTIRAWLAGKYKPPAGIVDELDRILMDRLREIENALKALGTRYGLGPSAPTQKEPEAIQRAENGTARHIEIISKAIHGDGIDLDNPKWTFIGKDVVEALQSAGYRITKQHPMDPDYSRTGVFVDHNCWKCSSGEKPCVVGNPRSCEYLHARND